MSLGRRIAVGAAVAVVGVLLVIGLVGQESGGGATDEPTGSSVADRGPEGLSTLGGLLAFAGHSVDRVETPPSDADLDPGGTVVMVAPGALDEADVAALRGLLDDGGRLVLAGDVDAASLAALAGDGVSSPAPGSPGTWRPLVPAPEVTGVARVAGEGEGAVSDAGPMLPLLEAQAGFAALVSSPGSGRLVVLADPSPLRNAGIARADNARFALDLAGDAARPVRFVERVAAAPAEGLAALPSNWLWAFGGLMLAGLVLVASRFHRLGPPERRARELPPPRSRYVDAVAVSLARTGEPASAAEPLRAAARERLLIRAGLPRDADEDRVRAAAAAAGLEPGEADVLVAAGSGDRGAIDAGRALAKLARKRT